MMVLLAQAALLLEQHCFSSEQKCCLATDNQKDGVNGLLPWLDIEDILVRI
jgi:hypothetical protein